MSLPCLLCEYDVPRAVVPGDIKLPGDTANQLFVEPKTEKILINHPDFHLPGKKALLLPDYHKITAMDATESPIERPSVKKAKKVL